MFYFWELLSYILTSAASSLQPVTWKYSAVADEIKSEFNKNFEIFPIFYGL